jgi:XTP/dITP diphosphohydrolase
VRLVLASGNPHKARELAAALPGWEVSLAGVPLPAETGQTFRENARAKAHAARARDAWAAGEDSGLEVAGLDGRPGLYSARYAGEDATDAANVAKLLGELAAVEGEGRRARYVCELVAVAPDGREVAARGELAGAIAGEPRGEAGFGYDPVFVPEGESRTVAELGDEWKSSHSHRARAAQALAGALGQEGGEL